MTDAEILRQARYIVDRMPLENSIHVSNWLEKAEEFCEETCGASDDIPKTFTQDVGMRLQTLEQKLPEILKAVGDIQRYLNNSLGQNMVVFSPCIDDETEDSAQNEA